MAPLYYPRETALSSNNALGEGAGATAYSRMPDLAAELQE